MADVFMFVQWMLICKRRIFNLKYVPLVLGVYNLIWQMWCMWSADTEIEMWIC